LCRIPATFRRCGQSWSRSGGKTALAARLVSAAAK
jgi:hypothetical protein